ncbi:MAG: hypothetical protein H7839_00025 [Magnetococcus sp. YQC-5]
MKLFFQIPSWLFVFSLGMGLAVAGERGKLEQEINQSITPSDEEKNGNWGIVDAIKLAMENDNSMEVIQAKGLKEVARGEYQEKSGAFNLTAGVNVETSQDIRPTPPWVSRDLQNLKAQEAALPGGSAPAMLNSLSKQAARAEQGAGTFAATDMKNYYDISQMSSGLSQLSDASIEKNTHKTTVTASLKQKFRPGFFAKLETILDRTDPQNYNLAASNGTNPLNIGIVQFNVRVPLLRNSGSDGYLWTVEEKEKKLEYKSKQQKFRHEVSNRVLAIAKAYWDYKASMEKLDILRAAEMMVNRWVKDTHNRKDKSINNQDAMNTLSARLAIETQELEEGMAAVFSAKVALAQALGIGVEELTLKGYPADEFPSDLLVNVQDDALKKRLFSLAQTERSDLLAAKFTEAKSTVLLTKAKKDLKPDLVVDMTAGIMGGNVEGSSVGNAMKGFTDNVVSPNWKVLVLFEYPFGNDAAEGLVTQRTMANMRDNMLLEQQNREVRLSVQKSLNSLKHMLPGVALTKKSIKNYWPSVEGALEKYSAQGQTSLANLVNLLDLAGRLKAALLKHITAKSDLAKALVDVRFSTGTLLPKGEDDHFVITKEAIVTLP